MHKTKRALIDTVLRLMDGDPSVTVTMMDVLGASGISSGSLYYHFSDYADLIDHAFIEIYTSYTKAGIVGLAEIIDRSATVQEAKAALAPLIGSRHGDGQARHRAAMAWIAAQATLRPDLQKRLGPTQREMTARITETIALGQAKGLVKRNLDPHVIAVFVQAYALGRVVDDVAGCEMDSKAWTQFIVDMVSESILADG